MDSPENSSDGDGSYWGYESIMSDDDEELSSQSGVRESGADIAKELLQGLNQFRESEMFCDITLKAGDVLIPAHKIVLCACSPYFNAMFSGQFTEKDKEFVVMEEMEGIYLRQVIDYIYSGNLLVNPGNVRHVLDVANFLQINSAQEICCEMLSREIKESNCLEFMEYAGKRSLKTLLRNATKCAAEHFCQIVSKDEFSLLDYDEIDTFLQEEELRNFADDMILAAIHKWINYAPTDRLKYLPELLVYVNPAQVTKEFIQESEYLSDVACEDWLLESQKSTPSEWYVYFFNRLGHYAAEKMEFKTKEAIRLKRLPEDICQCSFTAQGSTIYVQGGWVSAPKSSPGFSARSYAYNAYKEKWTEFIPLTVARANHRSCVLGGSLYNIGGLVNLTSQRIVERLDLITGQYISTSSLRRPRSSFGLAVYENSIYVIGGSDGEEFLCSVERYDPREGVWQSLSNPPYSMGECSCTIFQDNIYCAIGRGGAMERFDVKANEWYFIRTQDNTYPREIFTVDNELYGTFDKRISKYVPEKGQWRTLRRIYPDTNYLLGVPILLNA